MEFDSDKIREQLKHYGELAASIAKMDTKEVESHVREFLQSKSQNLDGIGAIDTLRTKSKQGIDTVSELIRNEFRQEFEEVARRGRTEVAQFIEKVVCLIEERFGMPSSSTDHGAEEKAWRAAHNAEKMSSGTKGGPKASSEKKASSKKSTKSKKDSPKKSSSKQKHED